MAEMTLEQFEVLAELLRSREPVKTAARLVLLEGVSTKAAAAATGMKSNAVSNALGRYRRAYKKVATAFCLG